MTQMKYANLYSFTDIHPYEVIKVVSEQTILIRRLDAELAPDWKPEFTVGGFSAVCLNQSEQKWVFTSNPKNESLRIRKIKGGGDEWVHKGRVFRLAPEPIKFYDYNF